MQVARLPSTPSTRNILAQSIFSSATFYLSLVGGIRWKLQNYNFTNKNIFWDMYMMYFCSLMNYYNMIKPALRPWSYLNTIQNLMNATIWTRPWSYCRILTSLFSIYHTSVSKQYLSHYHALTFPHWLIFARPPIPNSPALVEMDGSWISHGHRHQGWQKF